MSEQFRRVGTADISSIEIWIVHGDRINLDLHDGQRAALDITNARKLRDWLTAALPCDHKTRFTGYRAVDPFGKDPRKVYVANECTECRQLIGSANDGGVEQ